LFVTIRPSFKHFGVKLDYDIVNLSRDFVSGARNDAWELERADFMYAGEIELGLSRTLGGFLMVVTENVRRTVSLAPMHLVLLICKFSFPSAIL